MSKPLFIQADPKIRVHGDYNTGAAHINRARSALYVHLLEDSAYNIQVSQKKYTLAPGVECVSTHEYGQTYLDIYSKNYPVSKKPAASTPPAYFGSYITNYAVYLLNTDGTSSPDGNLGTLNSIAIFNSDGSLLNSDQIYYTNWVTTATVYNQWDFLGNNLVGLIGILYPSKTTPAQTALASGLNLYIIDTNLGAIIKTVPLGLNGELISIVYVGNNTINFLVKFITTTEVTGTTYLYNFVTNSLSILGSSVIPILGTGTALFAPNVGGPLNYAGARILGAMQANDSLGTFSISVGPDKNNSVTNIIIGSNYALGTNGYILNYEFGFTSIGDPLAVLYSQLNSITSTGSISAHFRVVWNGTAYDFVPDPIIVPSTAYSAVNIKIIPYGAGAIISTEEYLVYFENGQFVSYIFIGANSNNEDGLVDFCNTASRGLLNIFTGVTAGLGSNPYSNLPSNWFNDLPHFQGTRWVPTRPGDWLDYLSVYT